MSAVGIERGLEAHGWRLEVHRGRWETHLDDEGRPFEVLAESDEGYVAWVEEGPLSLPAARLAKARAKDRESAAMLSLVAYVGLLRRRE